MTGGIAHLFHTAKHFHGVVAKPTSYSLEPTSYSLEPTSCSLVAEILSCTEYVVSAKSISWNRVSI